MLKSSITNLLMLSALLIILPVSAADKTQSYQAEAKASWLPDSKARKKEFKFNTDINAWLRANGEWYVEGSIHHQRLRCGDYRLGIEFGTGKHGCIDAKWSGDIYFLGQEKQCNSVSKLHRNSGLDESLETQFEGVSCAKAIIECSGTCEWSTKRDAHVY